MQTGNGRTPMDGSPVPDPMLTDAATCTDAVAVGVSDDELDARYRLHNQEVDLLFEKRTRGLTSETQHPWSLEWLSPEEMAEAEAAAKKRLAPIRKVVDNLLALPLGRDPPQNKKSIEAQESAIKALANLEYYDLLANPDLLSQFAVIDKRFPEAPGVYCAAQLPDWSIKTWLPDAARDAIETWALDGTLDLTRLLELVFAKLEGHVCDFVLSWIQGVFNWNMQGVNYNDRNVQTGLLDAIQSLESNDNLKSVLPTLRLRVVRNLSPKRHGEILVGLMESGGEDVATAAVERFAPPCSPGPFCFDRVLHRLTRRRHADHYDFREEAISLVTERLVKALHNPLALKVLLANMREVAYPLTLMQKALLPLVGTLTQQMRRGDAATHTRQYVEALPPGGRIRMQCLPAFVEMLPDTFAMNMLLAACKCTSAQTTEIRVPDWELVEMERAKALLTEALPQCMAMLVRKAQNDDAGTKAAAKKVLVAVRDVSPELLVPYVEDIVIGDVSLFELAPMLPEDVRKEYAKTFARVAVRNKDGRIRRIAETALVITSKVVAKLFKYLTYNNTVVQDRALRLLCDKVADFALARHAEQILSAPDDHAFNLVEKLPVGVLEEQLISLVTYHVTHDSGAVRDLAAKALGKLADRTIAESTGTLAGYLQNDDEAVQARAVSLLGRVGSAALAPHVGMILSDPNRAAFQLVGKLARDELQAHDGAASTLVSLLKKGVPAAAIALDKLSSEALGHLSKLVMELWLQHLDVKLHKCARDLALKLPPDSIDERFKSELERLRGPLFLLDATDNYDRALGGSAAPESIVCDAVQMEVSLPKGGADAERPSTSVHEVKIMERIEEAYKEARRIEGETVPTPDKNTMLETVLIELFETDTACNNLKKAVEKCKNNWQLQIHPDKFSGDADLKEKAENCSALLNALWSMAPDFTSQSGGPGLTRALRKYELKLWPVRCKTAEASVPQKKSPPPEPPPEPPKPPPKLVHLDADKEASECLLQRMAFCGRNGETRLIVCDVSPDKLINQAATHVATLPIKFTGDASDVTAITAHVDQFLSQNGVLSEEKRSLVRSRAVERYLQNPEIAEDRKRVQTAVEESAVDDAKNQLLSDGKEKMPTPTIWELAKSSTGTFDGRGETKLLADANAALNVPEGVDKDRLAREVVANVQRQHCEAVLQAQSSVAGLDKKNAICLGQMAIPNGPVSKSISEEELEKQSDMHDRLYDLSYVNVDKSRWTKRGLPVEDDPDFAKPEAAPPEEAWNPGPARPQPPRAKATIFYEGATFDSFEDRPPHGLIVPGKYISPELLFLKIILNTEKKRGAIEVRLHDGKPELRVNGQSPVVGTEKIESYVHKSLMPFVETIDNLRRLGGPRMVVGSAMVGRTDSRFSVGHNAEGVAELRVEGPKPVVKQGAKDVLDYIEKKLPYEKDELKTLFQPVQLVSVDDFAPTVQTGVASLNPEALRKDEDGRKRLYACYDPYIENESERPLKSFDCDPAFRGLIEPPPEKARKALEAAERVLEEAKKAAARAKTQEEIAARETKLSSLREAVRAAEVDGEAKEAANASGLSRRIRRRPMPGGREEGYTEAEMPIYSAEVLLERAIEEAKKTEDDLCEAHTHVREAEAALREADASLIISVAFTRVMGRGEMTYVWLCGVEGCPDASFTTEAWLKTKFSEGWLKVCKAAPYVGRFRLVTKRAWHITPPKQTASIVPRPPVASKTPVLPTLDAVLQGALSQVDLWRRAAVQEFKEGWAPSPSDAYAIGFSKRDRTWWVLLATLGNNRPHPVVQDWVHRHFDASAFYSQGPDRPKLHERALTACLIHEDWRMGHAASDATSEAIRQVNDAVKAAADATANAATAAKLQLDIEAAQPHLPEEPIRSLMLSYTLKYRGAKSCWFAELESRKVVALHRSVVDACIEPAFRIKCWEAFVAVTAESLTMYGREVIHVVSDGPAVGQERPPSDPLPDGVNWNVYKRDDLLGIGCARKGDLGFREGASQSTEQWRVYYESNERTLSILLKGVLGTNQYKKSGKGSVADAISSDRGNAQKAKTPRSTQLPALHCPTAPLLLTHKLPVAPAHPPKRSKSSHSSTTSTANVADSNAGGSDEPPPPKRPKRAAAEKADKNFGAYDEVGVGEDGESGTDDFDESESDQSEIEVSKKRAKATGAMTSQKSARGAETMAVPTDVVMGTTPSMEPIPAQVERIKKALGLDASLTIPAALDAAETLLGRKAEGRLSHRATAVLAVVEELRGKVQRITPYLGLDEKLNLSDAIATACSMLLPADGTLLERADAMLAML